MEKFLRIQRFLGEERFRRLQARRIVVVGLGAVGGHVVEGLARAGVNNLCLVDFDTVQPSNINRQIFALTETIGRPKVEVGQERVLAINPDCHVEALRLFVDSNSMEHILNPRPDLLVDAIDSLNPKVQLLTEAYRRGIPIISSMGAALRTDPTQIRCADLFDTKKCPLARRLRARLRRNAVDRGILCVFSTEDVAFTYEDPVQEPQLGETPYANRGRRRRILGSLPTLTGIFGLIIANQAILRLAEKDTGLTEK